jgi:hypothetical protein
VPGVETAVIEVDSQGPRPENGRPLSVRQRRAAWMGVAVAVVAFWLLATSGQPWRLFEQGPFTSDFYDAQAHALLSGRLDVPTDVALIEGFDVDGRTYLYFGIGPALARLPFAVFGDVFDGRLTVLSQLIAVGVLGLGAARLLGRARRHVGDSHERPWVVGLFAAGVSLGTPVLFLASRSVVYHEAELVGAALAVLGLDLALGWWEHPTGRRLAAFGLVAALGLASRPTTGSAALIALGLFVLLQALHRRWRPALWGAVTGALVASSYVVVNLARFGQIASVPWAAQRYSAFDSARQAALAANDGSLVGTSFVPTTLWHYLSPFNVTIEPSRLFPFLTWSGRARVVGDATFDTIDRSASLWFAAPLLCVLAVVGLWWVIRHDRSQGWRVVAVAAVLGTAGTFTIGFVAHRYLVDFVPALVVLSAPAVWVVARWLGARTVAVRTAVGVVAVMVALLGTAGQVALAVQARYLYIVPDDGDRLSFMELQYRLDGDLFDGAPSRVVRATGVLPEPVDGTVAVLDDCVGLYRADGLVWHAVEWGAGQGRRLVLAPDDRTRTALAEGPVGVASGDGWTLTAEPEGEAAFVVVYRGPDGLTVRSEPIPRTVAELDVIADPATTQLIVRAGGETPLSMYYSPTEALTAASGWRSQPGSAPLCESLLERLPPSG